LDPATSNKRNNIVNDFNGQAGSPVCYFFLLHTKGILVRAVREGRYAVIPIPLPDRKVEYLCSEMPPLTGLGTNNLVYLRYFPFRRENLSIW
jgi:hypothetical protein